MQHLAKIAILISISLAMFTFESLLPTIFLPPGAKLGLSNFVIVVALYKLKKSTDLLVILIGKVILSTFFVGSLTTIIFSLSGGFLSILVMLLLKKIKKFSVIGISISGGFFHNLGQILAACCFMESAAVLNYFPVLGICGIFNGALIGIIAHATLEKLPRNLFD